MRQLAEGLVGWSGLLLPLFFIFQILTNEAASFFSLKAFGLLLGGEIIFVILSQTVNALLAAILVLPAFPFMMKSKVAIAQNITNTVLAAFGLFVCVFAWFFASYATDYMFTPSVPEQSARQIREGISGCMFQEVDDTGSMATCFTAVAFYSFAEAAASIREGSTGEAREALPEMKKEGIDIDARCSITITSEELNWSDLPNDTRSLSLGTPGKQMSAIGFYGTGSSPEIGIFGVPVNCLVLQEILSAGSVTLTWSSQKGEYSFSFSDESVPGFSQAIGHVVESAKSRN
jgi:hypothetical protein